MHWTSIIAIYFLVWIFCAFTLLPFGIKTHDELGMEKVPGQADSAPANFKPKRVIIRATIISAVLTTIYVLNFNYGWLTLEDLGVAT